MSRDRLPPTWGYLEILRLLAAGVAGSVILTLHRKIRTLELYASRDATYRPDLIILLRHGESEANADHTKYGEKGDPNVELTADGVLQAALAGDEVANLVNGRRFVVFVSPYKRTRQTADVVLKRLAKVGIHATVRREDPRLREREFSGTFQRKRLDTSDAEGYSRFFWRPPGGESCADVYDRITSFIDTLWRSFRNHAYMQGSAVLIVTHGLTMRVFAMRWLQWTPEMFHETWNPGNGGILVFKRQGPDAAGNVWYRLSEQSLVALGLEARCAHAESSKQTWVMKSIGSAASLL